jgi:tRNA threonylcarbamoyl adenosine modification protein (Sua5/YciO/YrdC/YwlC family)
MEEPLRGPFTRSMVTRIAAVLRDGGVVVLPTDTLYGFHCLATRLDAVERVRRLKKGERGQRASVSTLKQGMKARERARREKRSGFILLASDIRMVDRLLSRWPQGAREELARIWPAPLTAILPASNRIDRSLAPSGRAAIRIPALPELRALVKLCGEPLVSTSVNITGSEPMIRISEIMKAFPGLDAYISQCGRPSTKPSTIVDMTASLPKLLRPGRHPWPIR